MKARLARMFRDTLAEIDLERVMPGCLQVIGQTLHIDDETIDLEACNRIVIAAFGKAAYTMTASLAGLLAPRQVQGIAVGPTDIDVAIDGIETMRGSHPYPDESSLSGARALLDLVHDLDRNDLVIFLLSGGGSSLAECPHDVMVSLHDLGELHRLLVTGGADIVEMNIVRKHFSGLKGGRLAAAAAPARQITLFVSDVPADHPSAVASGPTMPDESTVMEVVQILERLELMDQLPPSMRRLLEDDSLGETPKPGDTAFARSTWHCLLNNQTALDTLHKQASDNGWVVDIDCSVDDWPLPDAVDTLLNRLNQLAEVNPGRTVCLLSGGELSCPVTGDGVGGRNQAFVLRAAQQIAGTGITVLSAGTDGIDGNSPAAGAVADGDTMSRAAAAEIDVAQYEQRSDSYHFFGMLDDVIITGPTGNNVRDLRLLTKTQEN